MTSIQVRSYTKTVTRPALLMFQIRSVLRRTTQISEQTLNNSIELGIHNRWINQFNVYAIDENNLCHAQLILKINWDDYDVRLSISETTVAIDNQHLKEASNDLDEFMILFSKFVVENSLTTHWSVSYRPDLNSEEINKKIGLTNLGPIDWIGKDAKSISSMPELPELRVGLYLAS